MASIIDGRRAITGDTALRLGHYFGNNPQCWLNLQAMYGLRLARAKTGDDLAALPTLARTLSAIQNRRGRSL